MVDVLAETLGDAGFEEEGAEVVGGFAFAVAETVGAAAAVVVALATVDAEPRGLALRGRAAPATASRMASARSLRSLVAKSRSPARKGARGRARTSRGARRRLAAAFKSTNFCRPVPSFGTTVCRTLLRAYFWS